MTEHILKMNKGDLALVITQNDGWFQKISVAYADDPDLDPLDINPNWLSLYKAITHLSLISDTYLIDPNALISAMLNRKSNATTPTAANREISS